MVCPLKIEADVKADLNLAKAWPSVPTLKQFPFDELTITGGSLSLDADFTAKSVDFTGIVTSEFSGKTLNTAPQDTEALLEITYADSQARLRRRLPGHRRLDAGFAVERSRQQLSRPPHHRGRRLLPTKDIDDTSKFNALKVAFLPSSFKKGFTFIGGLEVKNSIGALAKVLPSGTDLDLTLTVPSKTPTKPDIVASLTETAPTTDTFSFKELDLDWNLATTSISLTITALLKSADICVDVDLIGDGDLNYGAEPSAGFGIFITGTPPTNGWNNPFCISKDLTIDEFGFPGNPPGNR